MRFANDNCDLDDFWTIFGSNFGVPQNRLLALMVGVNSILEGSKKAHIFNSTTENWLLVDFWISLKSKVWCDKSPSFLGPCQQAQNVFSWSWNHPSKHETRSTVLGGDYETLPYKVVFWRKKLYIVIFEKKWWQILPKFVTTFFSKITI